VGGELLYLGASALVKLVLPEAESDAMGASLRNRFCSPPAVSSAWRLKTAASDHGRQILSALRIPERPEIPVPGFFHFFV